jgi:AGZA family xanthine/uracil permease-like MFS transporter
LTFFGFIHGEAIGFARTPEVAVAYLGVAIILFVCARYAEFHPRAIELHQAAEAD